MFNSFSKRLAKRWRSSRRLFRLVWVWLTRPVLVLQNMAVQLTRTLKSWWRSRNFRQLLAGLPVILVGCAATYIGIAAASLDRGQIVGKYQRAAKTAMVNQDFPAAMLYLERSIEQQPGNNEALFDLARAAEQTHDYPRMMSAMRKLAPENRPVHGPSHLWQATRLLTHAAVTPEQLRLAETHLLHALELRESTPLAHDLLGQMYFQLGLWAQAIPHLEASPDRSRRLMLAKAYSLSGNGEKGRSASEQARDYFAREAAANPQNFQLRVDWAEACMFLEQYPEAIRILSDALALHDKTAIRMALARTYVLWADSVGEATPNHRRRKFELLAAGMQAYPDELALYDRMLKLLESGQETAETARLFLQSNIVEGRAVGMSHLILGSNAFVTSKVDEAKLHLERAFELLPNADLVANNLAWLMIHADSPQADRAWALIQPVVERHPENARFLDTRGHVLLKLGRHKEAVHDLERALAVTGNNSSTHEALSSAYAELGLSDLARMHKAAAAKLAQMAVKK